MRFAVVAASLSVEKAGAVPSIPRRAEMKVPGPAWLEMTVEPDPAGGSIYKQRAIFFPAGLAGRLYWYSILPFHGVIFAGMANKITQTATHEDDAADKRAAEVAH